MMHKTKRTISGVLNWFAHPVFWLWAAPLLLIAPNIWLAITEYNSVLAKITNIILPLGLYMLLFSLSKKIGRTILFFLPIIILSGFQIVLLVLYGESIIAIDMYVNLLTTSASEAKELLGNLLGAISVIVILYLPLLVAAIIMYINKRYVGVKRRRHMRVASYVLLIIGTILFFITVLFTEGFMPRRELFPYNVAENLVTAIRRTNMSMHYHTTSREFNYSPVMTRDKDMPEVFVIVIGETSRAENWELFGYDRPTNPRLKQREGVYAFPKVLTEINTTHKAVPMLLSYLLPENFGDSVAYTKSIFSAFNNVGYRTAFLSNQKRNHSYLDNYGEEAQLAEFISDRGGTMRDINLIGAMNEIIDKSPSHKVFIVLHTYGSHFEYRKRYPSDMAYFTPDINSGATRFNREQLLNAYDNTIRYTDALLDGVIESLDNLDIPATMIFVSDHGEDIFDDERERFLHSSPTPTAHQIHVPMVIWLSKEFEDIHPDIVNALRNNKDKNIASTSSLFHTILDITGVRSPYYDATYSVASPKFTPRPRKYLNDYNESVPLTKSGIHQQDIEVFKKRNIDYE